MRGETTANLPLTAVSEVSVCPVAMSSVNLLPSAGNCATCLMVTVAFGLVTVLLPTFWSRSGASNTPWPIENVAAMEPLRSLADYTRVRNAAHASDAPQLS